MRYSVFSLLASFLAVNEPALRAQPATETGHAIVGAWRLNDELSEKMPAPGEQGGGREGRGGGGRGGGGGGFGGGGFGGGGRGGSGGGSRNPEDMERRREAMRQILTAPVRMTITDTPSMVIVTTGEGTTTRLATDNRKIKDESTGIERKTRWEGEKLVTEITGAGPNGKIVETYEVDPETKRLWATLEVQGGNNQRPPLKRVYDRSE